MRDGLSRASPADLTNIAQVEVIKGPQSALYGQTEPGGIVNYITKKPKESPGYRLTLASGSYDLQRAELEATGPLIGKKLFYLFTAGYRANKTDLEHYFSRRKIYTATFAYKLSADTSVTGYWEQSRTISNRGTGAVGELVGSRQSGTNPLVRTGGVVRSVYLPLIRFNQMGPNDHYVRDYDGANVRVEHRFNRVWSARANYELVWKEFHQDRWSAGLNYVPETGRLTSRTPFHQNQYERSRSMQLDLLGRFTAGGIRQQLLFAGDYLRTKFENHSIQYTTADIANTALLTNTMRYLDPLNPDWTPADLSRVTRFTDLQLRRFFVKGATASHRAHLLDGRLITMLSARQNYVSALVDDIAGTSPAGVPQFLGQGQERAQGFDLSLSARLTPALTILGTFGYVDATIRKHETRSLIGDRLTLTAEQTASGIARYSFLDGALKGLRVGAGMSYTGDTLVSAQTATRFRELHGPVQLYNAFASYAWRQGRCRHSVALNSNNLFDKFYLNTSNKLGRGRELSTTYTVNF